MNNGMYQGYSVEGSAELKVTPDKKMSFEESCAVPTMQGVVCPPIYECPQERCIHKQIVHEVPHVCPINTRIINHHIYKHTYSPCYTCTEENEICNVQENPCKFM
jgi:hypothetical protein